MSEDATARGQLTDAQWLSRMWNALTEVYIGTRPRYPGDSPYLSPQELNRIAWRGLCPTDTDPLPSRPDDDQRPV